MALCAQHLSQSRVFRLDRLQRRRVDRYKPRLRPGALNMKSISRARAPIRLSSLSAAANFSTTSIDTHVTAAQGRRRKRLQQALFESKLIGAERDKPFERDAFGQLKVKAGWVPLSIQSEIDGLNTEIATVAQLNKDHKLSDADAQNYTTFFKEQLAGLKTIQQHVGQQPYVISGTFLNREDSTSFPMRMFMNQTGRGETDEKHAYVDVELYDSTLSPGEPRRPRVTASRATDDRRSCRVRKGRAGRGLGCDGRLAALQRVSRRHDAHRCPTARGQQRRARMGDRYAYAPQDRAQGLDGVAAVGGVALLSPPRSPAARARRSACCCSKASSPAPRRSPCRRLDQPAP